MNKLEHLDEFIAVLSHYQMSSRNQELLSNIKLTLLSGPSAVGRNTIIDRLLLKKNYHYIVSDTTREPRINDGIIEENGKNYWFRSEVDFLKDLREGSFLEAEVIHDQQVSGISIRELMSAVNYHKTSITEIEIGGFLRVLSIKPDTVAVIVLPPSFDEWIYRLNSRSKMDVSETQRRLKTAVKIFSEAASNEQLHLVVNDHLERAVQEIDMLSRHESLPPNPLAKELAKALHAQTLDYLGKL